MRVIGVDGVRGRWVAVELDLVTATSAASGVVGWRVGTAAQLLAEATGADVLAIGVDIPIGLPAAGPRLAEQQARSLLGGAAASIFATAPAAAFAVARSDGATRATRPAADAASRRAGGGGLSMQAWMIAGKVLEVEDAVRDLGRAGQQVIEVHPETTFALLAQLAGVGRPASKRTAAGVGQRIALLQRSLPGLDVVAALASAPPHGGPADRLPVDDALDALAAACSALRHAADRARVLGAGSAAVWSDSSPAPGRGVIVV